MQLSNIMKGVVMAVAGVVAFSTVLHAQEPASNNYKLQSYGFGSGGVVDSVSPSTSVVGYWKFDEGSGSTVFDSSTYGNDGTSTNGPIYTTDTPDVNFSNPFSLEFDGVNDFVHLGSPPTLQITGDITLAAWIYLEADNISTITTWANNSFSGYPWHFLYHADSKKLRYNNSSISAKDSNTVVPIGEWVHAAVTKKDSTLQFYLNGVPDGTHTGISDGGSGNTFAAIGRSDSQYMHGKIDDLRIYDTALDGSSIEALANGENFGGYRLSGMLGELSGEQAASNNYMIGPGLTFTQQADVPLAPTFVNSSNWYNKLHMIINPSNNPVDAKFAVAISTDGFVSETKYVKMDGTVGDTLELEDYRTYAEWGGANGDYIIGLKPGTVYTLKVKAMHGDFTETGYGPSADAMTVGNRIRFDIDIAPTDTDTEPPYAIDLGDLFGGIIVGSTDKVWIDFETNAEAGGRIYIAGNNDGLLSNTVTHTISAVTGDLAAVTEGFGVQGDNASAGSGGPFTISSLYDVSGNTVGIADATIREIFVTDNPIESGRASFLLKAKSSNITPAANDYTEILNIIAASMF